MAKTPQGRMSDAAGLAAELREAAIGGYGEEWAERGRSHLAEAAALLLALLWPSGSAPAAQGSSIVHTTLTEPANQPAAPPGHAGAGHPPLNQHETGQPQPQPGHAQLNQNVPGHQQPDHAQLNQHQLGQGEQHLRHLEHLEHEHAEHLEHLEHLEHAEQVPQPGQASPGAARLSTQAKDAKSVAADAGTAALDVAGVLAQRLVRATKRSERVPRWIRRALPHDAGPRTSLAIVTGVVVVLIVLIVLISNVATSLTSGSPVPQAGPGGAAAGQGGQPAGPATGSAPVSYNPTITGSTYVDTIPSNMLESHVIDVDLTKVVDPAQEGSGGDVVAGNGDRLVALVFQIKCISGGEYGETEVKISTSDGQSYDPVIASIVGYDADIEGGVSISAGQSQSIVIPYLLPDGVKVTGVEWDPYLHYAGDENSHGEWTVQE